MRTTTKRGLGRSAGANGDGSGLLPPVIEPAITIYRQPEPPGRGALGLVGRILLWLLAAAAVVAAGLAGGAYLYFNESVAAVEAHTPAVVKAQRKLAIALPGKPAIALVIGYDKRYRDPRGEKTRSDTLMLLRADPRAKVLSMLSFPRDLAVEVHCPGKPPWADRINAAYGECGVEGAVETVRHLTGLPIHYLITVNFRGFTQMVAQLGGVWVDVDRRYFNDNSQGGERYATIDIRPGYQKLNGRDSLDFVRYRHTDSDLYRVARQQLFVKALKEQVTTAFSPTRIPRIVRVVTDNVEVGKAGGGAIPARVLWRYGLLAFQLPDGHFHQAKIDFSCYQGQFELVVPESCVDDAVRDFAAPDVEAPAQATDVALGRKPRPSRAPPAARTTMVVLNGNGVPGAAANTSYLLAKRGYVTLTPPSGRRADAPTYDYARTKVYFDARKPRSRAAAQSVAKVVGGADVAAMPRAIAPLAGDAMLAVVLGKSFRGLAPVPARRVIKPRPADVVRSSAAIAALRAARPRVPFPLLAPTRLPRGYVVSTSSPVRTYKVARHPAVRLTLTNGMEYAGVQMTTWDDPPILADPNTKVRLGRRTFELHYSGAHLHMVVLRRHGATYWVVNTLVNSLSNETMLAMAKSLRRVGR